MLEKKYLRIFFDCKFKILERDAKARSSSSALEPIYAADFRKFCRKQLRGRNGEGEFNHYKRKIAREETSNLVTQRE